MKLIAKKLIRFSQPALLLMMRPFFEKRYLTGRHFTDTYGGYLWGLRAIWLKNVLRCARPYPWPTGLTCHISNPRNLHFHPDDLNNFQSPGTYFQNFSASIILGRGTLIGPNVGIITANHKLGALDAHDQGADVHIGEACWIGMNSVILPGVTLGPSTIVAAGSVVNKSFPQGHVLIGGSPARELGVR